MTQIIPIRASFMNMFLLRDRGAVLVDPGGPFGHELESEVASVNSPVPPVGPARLRAKRFGEAAPRSNCLATAKGFTGPTQMMTSVPAGLKAAPYVRSRHA